MMGNESSTAPPVEPTTTTEWSPLAPTATAAAIGWKQSQSQLQQHAGRKRPRRRPPATAQDASFSSMENNEPVVENAPTSATTNCDGLLTEESNVVAPETSSSGPFLSSNTQQHNTTNNTHNVKSSLSPCADAMDDNIADNEKCNTLMTDKELCSTQQQQQAKSNGVAVEWSNPDAAILTFTNCNEDAVHVCIVGRALLQVMSDDDNEDERGGEGGGGPVIEVLGLRLGVHTGAVEIQSPEWTSAITLVSSSPPSTSSSSVKRAPKKTTTVQVSSVRQEQQSNGTTTSSSDTEVAAASAAGATFRIGIPSLDNNVRPTMIPRCWKSAMDDILKDVGWCCSSTVISNGGGHEHDMTVEPIDEEHYDASSRCIPSKTRTARVVVCGAKHVGKSTCIRYAVHRLLSSSSSSTTTTPSPSSKTVALLDCDAGQPEMSPPGMLTLTLITLPLLSPPHCHMVMGKSSTVAKHFADAAFYGHVTSKADPPLFVHCIAKLLQSYERLVQEEYEGDESKLPLLVNTDGWVKGMGFEILTATLDTIQPNHIIQLQGEVRSKVFDLKDAIKGKTIMLHEANSYQNSIVAHDSISVAPVAAIQSSMYRSLRLCTYFLGDTSIWDRIDCGQHGIGDYDCEIGLTLASMKPYAVSMDGVEFGTIRSVEKSCDLGSEDVILDALNASIVGLCCRGANEARDDTAAAIDCNQVKAVSDTCLSCLGLGLIRSIDRERRIFLVLTPVPMESLQTVNVLIGGSIQVPTECLYRGVQSESFPYLSCDGVSVGVGGEFMKSRNTILRKSTSL